jgi:hypothetical protein
MCLHFPLHIVMGPTQQEMKLRLYVPLYYMKWQKWPQIVWQHCRRIESIARTSVYVYFAYSLIYYVQYRWFLAVSNSLGSPTTFFHLEFFGSFSFRFAYFASFVFVSLMISSFSLQSETSEKIAFFSLRSEKFFASFSLRFASNRKRTAHPRRKAMSNVRVLLLTVPNDALWA